MEDRSPETHSDHVVSSSAPDRSTKSSQLTGRDVTVQLHIVLLAVDRLDIDVHVGEGKRHPGEIVRKNGGRCSKSAKSTSIRNLGLTESNDHLDLVSNVHGEDALAGSVLVLGLVDEQVVLIRSTHVRVRNAVH